MLIIYVALGVSNIARFLHWAKKIFKVEQARISDEGMYVFDAQNGRATCTAKVHVKREPAVVIRPLDAQKVRDCEKTVEFEVEFSRGDISARGP